VKEVAVLRKGNVLSHYIFASPLPWNLLTKSDKSCASWLIANHGLQWKDEMVPYSMVKYLFTSVGSEDDDATLRDIRNKNRDHIEGYDRK